MTSANRSRERWLALALAVAMTLLTLYAGELVLRVLRTDPGFLAIEAAQREGREWDTRSRIEVVEDLREKGVPAVSRSIPAALLEEAPDGSYRSRLSSGGRELLPLGGIAHRTVVVCNELGFYATYESDEHGFRNPTGLFRRAPVEVVLIGDSFTLGECVRSEDALGARIRARHPTTVNLGMGGNAPLLELAGLEEYGSVLRPRRVVWFYFENDLWWFDLGINARSPLLMRYLEPGFRQGLISLQPEIDARLEELWASGAKDPVTNPVALMREIRGEGIGRLLRFATLAKLRDTARGLLRPPASPAEREPPDFELFERILAEAKRRSAAWGGELYFVYLPGVWNFDQGLGWRPRDDAIRRSVLETAARLGLPVVDVQQAMQGHEDPLSLFSYPGTSILGPPHLNPDGYAFVAERVLEALER